MTNLRTDMTIDDYVSATEYLAKKAEAQKTAATQARGNTRIMN